MKTDSRRQGARTAAVLAAAGLALGAAARAQIGDGSAFLSGTVVDEKGYNLRNVVIAADDAYDTTDVDGRFGPGKGHVVALRGRRAGSAPGMDLVGNSLRFTDLPRGSTLKAELLLASGRRAGTSVSLPAIGGRAELGLDVLSAGLPREGLYVLKVDAGDGVRHHLLARVGGGSWVLSSQGAAVAPASGGSYPGALRKASALPATVQVRKPGYVTRTVEVPPGGDLGKVTLKLDPAATTFEAPMDVELLWYPSGWMGDVTGIKVGNETANVRPGDPDRKCLKWTYDAPDSLGMGWGAVVWQYPANNWGAQPGRRVTGAMKVSFWARGETGGETLDFKTGNDTWEVPPAPDMYKDSYGNSIREVLGTEWRKYAIPLDGMSTEQVIFGFLWAANPDPGGAPVTFYVDEIRFE